MDKQKQEFKPSFGMALIPLIGLMLCLGIGYGYYRFPTQVCMMAAAAIAAITANAIGLSWTQMMDGIKEKINLSLPSIMIMICVGGMISSWIFSGTIPMMIYYGIEIINPQYLFVTAFFVCAIISSFTGTSFGSAGTAGVAIMGVAIATGAPLAITAGAVLSGAVSGDKMSPFSDKTILAPIAADCDLYDHIRHMMYTTGAASIVAIIVYVFAGMNLPAGSLNDAKLVNEMLGTLSKAFNFNILLLLPPALIIIGAYLKRPTIPVMVAASFVAIILGMMFQDFSFANGVKAFYSGFNVNMAGLDPKTTIPQIKTLLNRGGLMSMMSTILLIICAISFGGIYSASGCIKVILEKLTSSIKSVGGLITSTVAGTIFMSLVTGSSYLAILVPGEIFRGAYDQMGLAHKNLSRTLEDAGTCVVPLVPWAIAGTFMSKTLGVPTLEYLPWAVMLYSSFIFAIIYGFTGLFIAKAEDEKTE